VKIFLNNNLNKLSQNRVEGFALVVLVFTVPNHRYS